MNEQNFDGAPHQEDSQTFFNQMKLMLTEKGGTATGMEAQKTICTIDGQTAIIRWATNSRSELGDKFSTTSFRPQIEAWEYQRVDWLRQLVDRATKLHEKVDFLPPSVSQVCQEIGQPAADLDFKKAVSQIYPGDPHFALKVAHIRDVLLERINGGIGNDYRAYVDREDDVRFKPTSAEGQASLRQKNQAYEKLCSYINSLISLT